jgi:uncharacterized membrane protein
MRNTVRILLGLFLILAGIGHLTFSRHAFQAQVPSWLPMNPDLVIVLSGIVEIILGTSLVFFVKQRIQLGWMVAVFFVLVFPGNIAQLTEHRDSFGLNSDLKRWIRLPFQFFLIFLALWSTGAWQRWRRKNQE